MAELMVKVKQTKTKDFDPSRVIQDFIQKMKDRSLRERKSIVRKINQAENKTEVTTTVIDDSKSKAITFVTHDDREIDLNFQY